MVSISVLRSLTPPTSLQLTKYYYKLHIEDIKRKLHKAKELGPASAEEWIKGLDHEGKERANDAVRWEQWEARGGLRKVNLRPQSKRTATPVAPATYPDANTLKRDLQPLHPALGNSVSLIIPSEGYQNPVPTVVAGSVDRVQIGTCMPFSRRVCVRLYRADA